jgi:hypothetical protein
VYSSASSRRLIADIWASTLRSAAFTAWSCWRHGPDGRPARPGRGGGLRGKNSGVPAAARLATGAARPASRDRGAPGN